MIQSTFDTFLLLLSMPKLNIPNFTDQGQKKKRNSYHNRFNRTITQVYMVHSKSAHLSPYQLQQTMVQPLYFSLFPWKANPISLILINWHYPELDGDYICGMMLRLNQPGKMTRHIMVVKENVKLVTEGRWMWGLLWCGTRSLAAKREDGRFEENQTYSWY